MSLSTRAQRAIKRAVTEATAATEIITALDAAADEQAASVAAIGSTTDLVAGTPAAAALTPLVPADWLPPGYTGTYGNAAEPTGGEIDTVANDLLTLVEGQIETKADNEDVETLRTEMQTALDLKADQADYSSMVTAAEVRLAAIETKVDALISALKTAGLMAS